VKAEQLITNLLEGRSGRMTKGEFLTGSQVAALKPKQGILINGRRAVVIDVVRQGNNVELTYARGARSFSKDLLLIIRIQDKITPVQMYARSDPTSKDVWIYRPGQDEGITRGMKNAYAKQENKKTCPACGTAVPKYPGRYPNKCPECGAEYES
jgi:hypothetical protein